MLEEIPQYCFELEFEVRDYEVDRFDMVNNAVYQNYLEHTRHAFLHTTGISVTYLREAGYQPVVTQADIHYKAPLRSGDRFVAKLGLLKLGKVKFVFVQDLFRLPDLKWMTHAMISGTVLDPTGRPRLPSQFYEPLQSFLL